MSAAVTGVILAGGEGRRMGGADKGLQLLNGRPLVQLVLERLRPQVDVLLISANRNLERYAGFGGAESYQRQLSSGRCRSSAACRC